MTRIEQLRLFFSKRPKPATLATIGEFLGLPPKTVARFIWDYVKSGHVIKHDNRVPFTYSLAPVQPPRRSTGTRYKVPEQDAGPKFTAPMRVASVFHMADAYREQHESVQAQELKPLVD